MQISTLHIITNNSLIAEQACLAGANWIQLRIKDKPKEVIEQQAFAMRKICTKYGARFILNDFVDIALKVNADGVHLGKNDMHPIDARELLGSGSIIGGTANSMEDIRAIEQHVNYIGLGPFRYTKTKQGLSPVLGVDGYTEIKTLVPVIAIGGITAEDINALVEAGVHGVAVSSAIENAEDVKRATKQFIQLLQEYGTVSYC